MTSADQYRERIPERPAVAPGSGRLGRNVWHDARSRAYRAPLADAVVSVRHERHIGILDQGALGSCFPPGTLIRMADGSERQIEDVRLLERVVTAEGRTGRVMRTMVRDDSAGLLSIKLWGHSHLCMTREHPVLTSRGYVEARDLRIGDEVALTKYVGGGKSYLVVAPHVGKLPASANTLPEKIELSPDFGRLLGLWLADGNADGNKVRWTFGSEKKQNQIRDTVRICEQMFGVTPHVAVRSNNCTWVTLYGTGWSRLFRSIGGDHTVRKRLHGDVSDGPREFLRAVFDGWVTTDGSVRPDGTREGVTISHHLAVNMYDIAQAEGLHPVLDYRESPQNAAAVHRKPKWTLSCAPGTGRCRQDASHVWRKVRELQVAEYDGPVYNLSVEGDESYVAEGVGVHNCTGNAMVGGLGCSPTWDPLQVFPDPPLLDQALAVAIYSEATRLDEFTGTYPPDDTGSSGLGVCKAAKARGLIGGYQWAFGLEETIRAACLNPVLIGVNWYSSFDLPSDDGELWLAGRAYVRGGHELVITEVDAENERVWIDNSWGPEWGVAGRAWMSWATLGRLLEERGDAVVPVPLDVDVRPQPVVDAVAWWRRWWWRILQWLGLRP